MIYDLLYHINSMEIIKRYGNIIIFVCIILEMLIWPSINNFFGCLMTAITWLIFSKIGLNEQIIREHIFAWLVFMTMSLYRIMPLILTMLEGHSIGDRKSTRLNSSHR